MSDSRLFKVLPPMSEKQFMNAIREGLTREHWLHQHVYTSKLADGTYRTTTTANGFPDLLAFKPPWVLAIETKKDKSQKATPQQIEWLTTVAELPNGLAWLLHPGTLDWQILSNHLHRPERAPRLIGFEPTRPIKGEPPDAA